MADLPHLDLDLGESDVQGAAADVVPSLNFLEYESPNGDKYRIERGVDLIADFTLAEPGSDLTAQLKKWHSALSGQEPAWTIICRLYGNAPLYGVEDPDELRTWTLAELAEKRGVEPREIEAYLDGAKSFWKRWQIDQEDGPGPARLRPAPDADTIDQLLRENGFGDIEDAEERKYVAGRCQDLEDWLDNEQLRSAARGLIRQEAGIFFILDPTVRELREHIRDKLADVKPGCKPDMQKDRAQLLGLMKEQRDAHDALNATMATLGLTDKQGGGLRQKINFQGCLSDLIKAMQEYHALGDRGRIDAVFTAAEVDLLTTPTALRPAQYRADLIVSLWEARQHLWESDWSPTPLSRRACRKLAKGFAVGLLEARSEEGEVALEEATEEDLLDGASQVAPAPISGPLEPPTIPISVPRAKPQRTEETAAMVT